VKRQMTTEEFRAKLTANIAAGKLTAGVDPCWLTDQVEITDPPPGEADISIVTRIVEEVTGRDCERESYRREREDIQFARGQLTRRYGAGSPQVQHFDHDAANHNV